MILSFKKITFPSCVKDVATVNYVCRLISLSMNVFNAYISVRFLIRQTPLNNINHLAHMCITAIHHIYTDDGIFGQFNDSCCMSVCLLRFASKIID